MNPRQTLFCATLAGALFVAIGALGAHFVPAYLERQGLAAEVIAKRVQNLEIGVRYHAYHALALIALSLWMTQVGCQRSVVGPLFLIGLVLFSGFLYLYALTGIRWTVHIVPLGGLTLILAWLAWMISALRAGR